MDRGRVKKVYVQAAAPYRMLPDDINPAAGGSCPVVPAPFAVGQSPNRLGRSQYRFCPAGPDSFGGMCAEQGKPQRYQYRIHGNQRVLGVTDGGNCCACRVPYFRSVRKLLCGKLLDVA